MTVIERTALGRPSTELSESSDGSGVGVPTAALAAAAAVTSTLLVAGAVLSFTALGTPPSGGGDCSTALTASLAQGDSDNGADCGPEPVADGSWVRPVPGGTMGRFRTRSLPNHQGIDMEAARDTVINATSSGTVITVVCNLSGRFYGVDHTPSPCDKDGSPSTTGCGWYVEIRHADSVVSRYCHMVRTPDVRVGQTVTTGQPIGLVGTSGHSSGPHLHFEIHTGEPAGRSNAVDPVPFLAHRGVDVLSSS